VARFRFGNVELDTASYTLTRDDERVAVEPQVFEVLAYLVEHRDRLVPRTELFDEIDAIDGVTLTSPYSTAGASIGLVATDGPLAGQVAYAQVDLSENLSETETGEIGAEIADLAPTDVDGLQVEVGGQALGEFEPPESELIGLGFAIVILILSFGSVLAMGLPIGVALFGFTLSYDEFARTLLTAGSHNTLPLEIYGMTTNVTTPVIFALGTLTTIFSLVVIGVFLLTAGILNRAEELLLVDERGDTIAAHRADSSHPLHAELHQAREMYWDIYREKAQPPAELTLNTFALASQPTNITR